MAEERLMTVKEVAAYLHVCPMTVYLHVEHGRLPYIKNGTLIGC